MAFARKSRFPRSWALALVQRRALIILTTIAYISGLIIGGISVSLLEHATSVALRSYLMDSFTQIAEVGAGYPNWQWVVVDEALKPAGLIWVLGMTVVGMPLIAVVVFMHGYVLGFSLAYIIKALYWRGIPLTLVAIIPHQLFMIPGLILVATGAISLSLGALRIVLGRPGSRDIFQQLRSEGAVALVGWMLLLTGSLFSACVTPTITAFMCRLLL
jgi:stage II sporulation protein M